MPNNEPKPIRFSRKLSCLLENGREIQYTAAAGETHILDENSKPAASIFSIDYLAHVERAPHPRPVTFIFNGGPGSSSQWLHMGGLAPKLVDVPSEPMGAASPPFKVSENPHTLLDTSDLVFIDAIGTGYSRPLADHPAEKYWGLLEDAKSIADFIQLWITNNQRWNSPKYILAESYGTTRGCLVADLLTQRNIALNGISFVSAVLDYQNSRPRAQDGAILPYVSFLPTFAAIAHYHGLVEFSQEPLEAFLKEVRLFSRTTYAQALIANSRLSEEERKRVTEVISKYTGLASEYVSNSRLRIRVDRFFKELLRTKGLVLGRLDGRYTGAESDSISEHAESDPAYDAIGAAFSSAVNTHLAELGVAMPFPYVSMRAMDKWNWLLEASTPNGGGYINVVPHLGRAMRRNPELRVQVASGYYDLATPFFGAENALSQDSVPQDRISYKYYAVGHMIFLHGPSRLQFLRDVKLFIAESISAPAV